MSSRTYPFALPRGTEISGYIIERVLGAGGFGITYAATNPVTSVTVAVKEFYPQGLASREGTQVLLHSDVSSGSYEQALKKFEQEAAKLTARYRHPNIVSGMNFLRSNNTAYFIMEFVEGVSFDDWLAAQTNVPDEAQLRTIFEQVLDAVAYIHGRDGMHRDLTPRNIMVRPDGTAVLVDFGAAGEGLDTDRGVSTAFAQPNYAPPEQLAGDDSRLQGRHTDIFSLGGVLYKSIAGYPPAKPLKRSHEVSIAGPGADPYVPAERAAQYPDAYSLHFLRGIDAALRLDYRQRPATIDELKFELGWIDDGPGASDLPTMPVSLVSPGVPTISSISLPPTTPSGSVADIPFAPEIPTGLISADDISAHASGTHGDAVAAAIPDASRPPQPTYPDTRFAETTFMLPQRHRGGPLLTVTLIVGAIVAAALAWLFATGDVPFRELIGGSPPQASTPSTPPVVAQTPAEPKKEPSKQPLPEPSKDPQREPVKPAAKVDFAEFAGFVATGRELGIPIPAPVTPEACRTACADNAQCKAFQQGADSCRLYSDVTSLTPDQDVRLSVRADAPAARTFRQLVDLEARRRTSFKSIDGVTLPGGTPTQKPSVSREQCLFTCTSDATCKAYSFASLVGACRIYTQVQPGQAKPAVGVITHVDDPDGQISAEIRKALGARSRTFKAYPGLELGGANPRHGPQPDAAACRQTCLEDQTCIAASFVEGDCSRLSAVETIRPRAGADGFLDTTDPKLVERVDETLKREAKGDVEMFPGFDLIGTTIFTDKGRTAGTPEECQVACKEGAACTGFSFLHADRKCTLVTAVLDAIPDPSRTSGLFRGVAAPMIEATRRRIQLSEAQRANFRDMPATCSPQGPAATTQLSAQAAPEQCAYLCRSGANCQAWVFNRNDHTCGLLSSVTGGQVTPGFASGVLDPTGKRVADLVRTCGPVPPGGLIGTPASECDRQAGLVNDPELPRGVDPRPLEFIDPVKAIPACQKALESAPNVSRWRVSLGRALERSGRMVDARQAYLQAAQEGSATGAFLYAILANKGQGGPGDDVEAERYFRLARSRGYAPASAALGVLYTFSSRVSPPPDTDALTLLEEAASRGQASSMYRLGEAYERGRLNRRVIPVDTMLAQQWYARALDAFKRDAEAKDISAYRYLSLMYDSGKGVPRDTVEALRYLVTYLSSLYGPDNTIAQSRGTVGDLRLDDWSVETRRAFQQYLRDRGAFSDAADGAIGSRTIDAVDRWLGLKG